MLEPQPDVNPFAAPASPTPASSGAASASDSATQRRWDACRRQHLGREGSVRAVGILSIAGSSLMMAFMVLIAIGQVGRSGMVTAASVLAVTFVFGGLGVTLGVFLRRFNPVARRIYTLLVSLLLILGVYSVLDRGGSPEFMFGGLLPWSLPAWFLYLLWSDPAAMVFSEYYRTTILPNTAHIASRTSPVLWVGSAILLLLTVLIIVGLAMLGSHPPR